MIVMKRLPDGRKRVVQTTSGSCASVFPSVWDHIVVWHQEGVCHGHRGSDVMMFDAGTGKITQVTHNHGASEAVTNGRYVAWKQGTAGSSRFGDAGYMILLDLETGKRTAIDPPPYGCKPPECIGDDFPLIGSRLLAWRAGGGAKIVVRDLKTGHNYVAARDANLHGPGLPGQVSGRRIVLGRLLATAPPGQLRPRYRRRDHSLALEKSGHR